MKRFNLFTLLVCTLLLVGCDYDAYEDEKALTELENGNRFVRLLTGGATGTSEFVVSETTPGSIPVVVENLFSSGEDLTVEYGLGGTAVFGEDYTIEGATASGGTVTVFDDNGDPEDTSPAAGVISIELFIDTLIDGPKTIIVELLSATSPNGDVYDVGQGDLRQSTTIDLIND